MSTIVRKNTLRSYIISLARRRRSKGITTAEIMDETGALRSTASAALTELAKAGLLYADHYRKSAETGRLQTAYRYRG